MLTEHPLQSPIKNEACSASLKNVLNNIQTHGVAVITKQYPTPHCGLYNVCVFMCDEDELKSVSLLQQLDYLCNEQSTLFDCPSMQIVRWQM